MGSSYIRSIYSSLVCVSFPLTLSVCLLRCIHVSQHFIAVFPVAKQNYPSSARMTFKINTQYKLIEMYQKEFILYIIHFFLLISCIRQPSLKGPEKWLVKHSNGICYEMKPRSIQITHNSKSSIIRLMRISKQLDHK